MIVKRHLKPAVLGIFMAGCASVPDQGSGNHGDQAGEIRIITLDPGHFHAALPHRERYAGVSSLVHIYAPVGPDLTGHLQRVARFNSQLKNPTDWRLEVHAGPDFFDRMRRERQGNVVVISGRNGGKIDLIEGSIAAGFHVLVDKPWILKSADLERLERALDDADSRGLVALDMMTERHDIATMLQKELVNDASVFGDLQAGTPDQPAVYMESVHHLMKVVAGAPNIRPIWYFDGAQQGEGLNDIGTHLVDLVPWTLWPDQAIDHQKDIAIVAAQRWPTVITEEGFRRVTASEGFPDFLRKDVRDGKLNYFGNTLVTYTIRGVHVQLNVIWDWEAPAGRGDSHHAVYRGSRARVEVRQGKNEKYRPEVYVVPNPGEDASSIAEAIRSRTAVLATRFPGLTVEEGAGGLRVAISEPLRTAHEQHFGEVARRFFTLVQRGERLPAWEKANMLAKYAVTTRGTELARTGEPREAPRLAPE